MTFQVREALLAQRPLTERTEYDVLGIRRARIWHPFTLKIKVMDNVDVLEEAECKKAFEGVFKFGAKQICTRRDCEAKIITRIVSMRGNQN